MTWTPPAFNAGQYPPAAELEYAFDQIADLTAPGWTDYSPNMVITGSTTNPTLGNSTLLAMYREVPGTDIVHFVFKLTIGSTFSAGNGFYTFSTPHTMLSPLLWNGWASFFDLGVAFYTANLVPDSSTRLTTYKDGSGVPLGNSGPGTAWAAGDFVAGGIFYGVA